MVFWPTLRLYSCIPPLGEVGKLRDGQLEFRKLDLNSSKLVRIYRLLKVGSRGCQLCQAPRKALDGLVQNGNAFAVAAPIFVEAGSIWGGLLLVLFA